MMVKRGLKKWFKDGKIWTPKVEKTPPKPKKYKKPHKDYKTAEQLFNEGKISYAELEKYRSISKGKGPYPTSKKKKRKMKDSSKKSYSRDAVQKMREELYSKGWK